MTQHKFHQQDINQTLPYNLSIPIYTNLTGFWGFGVLQVLHLLMKCVPKAERMMKLPKYETKTTADPKLSNFLTDIQMNRFV